MTTLNANAAALGSIAPQLVLKNINVTLPKGGTGTIEAYDGSNPLHLPGLLSLIEQQARFHGTEFNPDDAFKRRINADMVSGTCQAVFLVVQSQVAGVITFYPGMSDTGRTLYLEDIVVDESHKNRGFGKLLMQNLAHTALSLGCESLVWEVAHNNDPALALYRSINTEFPEDVSSWRISAKTIQSLLHTPPISLDIHETFGRLAPHEGITKKGNNYAMGYGSYSTFNAVPGLHIPKVRLTATDPQLAEKGFESSPQDTLASLIYGITKKLHTPETGNIDIKASSDNVTLLSALELIGAKPLAYADRMVIGKLNPTKTAALAKEFSAYIR